MLFFTSMGLYIGKMIWFDLILSTPFLTAHLHRDVRSENYMMDPSGLYAERFHCWAPDRKYDLTGDIFPIHRRTEAWPRYHIIDFGHSSKYPLETLPVSEYPREAFDNSAPEFNDFTVSDPFPIDVHRLGNLIRMEYLTVSNFSEFDRNGNAELELLIIGKS